MTVHGAFVSIAAGADVELDGFWCPGRRRHGTLVVFQHGLGSNFLKGGFKKALLTQSAPHGFDFLSLNNRGCNRNSVTERFTDCLKDLDLMLAFGRKQGYRRFVLFGHSTGSQKVTYYQSRRQRADVKAVVLAAPADDYAVARRDLGGRYGYYLRKANRMVAAGRGDETLIRAYFDMSARRFLSVADPTRTEAALFDYSGRLTHFRRLRCPVLALFGAEEEYAPLPVARMGEILRDKTRAARFAFWSIPGADHGFHGKERATAARIYRWLRSSLECEKPSECGT